MDDTLSPQETQSLLPHHTPSWHEVICVLVATTWTELLAVDVQAQVPNRREPAAADPWQHRGCRIDLVTAETSDLLIAETDGALTAALIDAQVGATKVSPLLARGTLTEIESRLMSRAMDALRTPLNQLFDSNLTLSSVGEIRALSADLPPVDPSAATAMIELRVLETTGMLQIHFTPQQHQRAAPPVKPAAPREWTAVLAELRLPAAELADLAVGDLITSDTPAHGAIQLQSSDGPSIAATAGRLGDLKAVQRNDDVAESTGPPDPSD